MTDTGRTQVGLNVKMVTNTVTPMVTTLVSTMVSTMVTTLVTTMVTAIVTMVTGIKDHCHIVTVVITIWRALTSQQRKGEGLNENSLRRGCVVTSEHLIRATVPSYHVASARV